MKNYNYFILLIFTFLIKDGFTQMHFDWMKRYHGPYNGSDGASSIVVDDSGNVVVTGYSQIASSRFDYITIKYNKFGDSIWTARYGDGYNIGYDIVIDDSGNVYVAGAGPIIKYNRNGNIVWISENYQVNYKILLDSAGNIYVAGVRWYDYITAKYDRNGNRIWNKIYHYEGQEHLRDMVIDNQGNIIVTGDSQSLSSSYDYATVKYSNNGQQLWVRRYNGTGISSMPYDGAHAVSTDDKGNVYVTGVSQGFTGGDNCVTIKYDSSGNELWISRITAAAGGFDIGIDGSKNVYIAGRYGGSSYTFKLDSNSNFLWGNYYSSNDGFASNYPKLILDSINNLYVTANSTASGNTDYAFVKYDSSGNELYSVIYIYSVIGDDYVNDFFLDKRDNIYLTGKVQTGGGYAYATVKYSPIITNLNFEINQKIDFKLFQNYPNPFNPITKISYELPASRQGGRVTSYVSLKVYDMLGKGVATLVNQKQNAGRYEVEFDGSNLASGLYFYTLKSGSFTETKKMLLIK